MYPGDYSHYGTWEWCIFGSFVLLGTLQLGIGILFYAQSGKFPIKQRFPGFVLMSTCFLFGSTVSHLVRPDWVPCVWSQVSGHMLTAGATASYTARAWILVFKFNIHEDLQLLHQGSSEGWYVKHRRLMKPKYVMGASVLYVLIVTCYSYLTLTLCPELARKKGSVCVECFTLKVLDWVRILIFHLFPCFVGAVQLRGYQEDAYFIKKEVTFIGIVLVASTSTQIVGTTK